MLKNILELNGARTLNRTEQLRIQGGHITETQCQDAGGAWNCGGPTIGCNCLFPFPKPTIQKK